MPLSNRIAAACFDRTVSFYDILTGEFVCRIGGLRSSPTCVDCIEVSSYGFQAFFIRSLWCFVCVCTRCVCACCVGTGSAIELSNERTSVPSGNLTLTAVFLKIFHHRRGSECTRRKISASPLMVFTEEDSIRVPTTCLCLVCAWSEYCMYLRSVVKMLVRGRASWPAIRAKYFRSLGGHSDNSTQHMVSRRYGGGGRVDEWWRMKGFRQPAPSSGNGTIQGN